MLLHGPGTAMQCQIQATDAKFPSNQRQSVSYSTLYYLLQTSPDPQYPHLYGLLL